MKKPVEQNILVVKNRALGDSIMGLSTVQYIRELFPTAKIYYALPAWMVPLYENVETAADEILSIELGSLKDWLSFWKKISQRDINLVYEMQQSGRCAKFFKAYSFFKGVPYFFHNHHLKGGTEVYDQGVIKSVIQRDLDGPFSFFTDKTKHPHFHDYCPRIETKSIKNKNIIFFGVVATRDTKKWPLSYYMSLAKEFLRDYPNMEIKIPLSKGKDDLKTKDDLIKLGLPDNCEIVHIPLNELPQYMGKGSYYIGNDTGLKHLAVALGLETMTFFGPEPPNEWHPYKEDLHKYFYVENLECRTRTHHYCGLSTCDSMICLNEFSPGEVFKQIVEEFKIEIN